jgi:hypothetical protein
VEDFAGLRRRRRAPAAATSRPACCFTKRFVLLFSTSSLHTHHQDVFERVVGKKFLHKEKQIRIQSLFVFVTSSLSSAIHLQSCVFVQIVITFSSSACVNQQTFVTSDPKIFISCP